ncbi:MAG: hypothetical protein R3A78_09920 [Polyangiales bacterium]
MPKGSLAALAVLSIAGLTACGGAAKFAAIGSARAPGADAVTQVEEIEGGQLLVTVHVTNLPTPDRVAPETKDFVVWFTGPDKRARAAGVLTYNEEAMEGTLAATTPLHSFSLRITAEADPKAQAPSDYVVIDQHIDES